ncbi:hypothetical protein DMENIID0001_122030 [Sergentomyia squamirostris]
MMSFVSSRRKCAPQASREQSNGMKKSPGQSQRMMGGGWQLRIAAIISAKWDKVHSRGAFCDGGGGGTQVNSRMWRKEVVEWRQETQLPTITLNNVERDNVPAMYCVGRLLL